MILLLVMRTILLLILIIKRQELVDIELSQLFLEIKKIEGVDCRIVSNDNHMFIEVKEGVRGWIKIDLGGSSITLESGGQIVKTQPARRIIEDAPVTIPRASEVMKAEEISELQQQEIRINLEQKIEVQQKIEEQKQEDKFGPFKKLLDSKEKNSMMM